MTTAEGAADLGAPRSIPRPWGQIERVTLNRNCSVHLLRIASGHRLSLHRHERRDESFLVILGTAHVSIERHGRTVSAGDHFFVPRGVYHRLSAVNGDVLLLEVAFGEYDQANDIERTADDYGRPGRDGSV